ncbi:L-arabinose isomerase [Breznakia pachnodae]|uniref:L-arabinose isomerase n=1 Tax=Breznakia pachnodae TaxID=265178 RepID=A0ABU0E8H9_9FIRM|nr:L-arabinose isomerase [Breznakia pachnodae]MDQ0363187.1 L-arabinose isomerase [Breznakia pachnodae]
MENYNFWFIVGSQDLYGEETLKKVNEHSLEMVNSWNVNKTISFNIVWKPVVRNSKEISDVIKDANNDEECIGLITWMHTFSPSKMWISGLKSLKKPILHINTQYNKEIPWSDIDMDFMNLNQSAHGDREHGFILARMRIPQKVICGYWREIETCQRIDSWMRAAIGAHESNKTKVLRISDNMRDVAVTEGDKVEAAIKLGWTIDYYGVGDIIDYVNRVTEDEISKKLEEYKSLYDFNSALMESIRYQAKEEIAIEKCMKEKGDYNAFHTNFQDLQALRQLPGLSVQNLMRKGYGFAGEGDWKTAALCRIMKQMVADKENGTGFMEDYTYHLNSQNSMNLGSHMLEVCPSFADEKPRIIVSELDIGGREAPARLVFKAKAGNAILVTLTDMGGRFRMICHDIVCQNQDEEMPNLPVAGVLWKPLPDFITGTEAWIYAGGGHHSVLSYDLTADIMRDFAEIMQIEFVHIDKQLNLQQFRKELDWNDLIWKFKG